MNTWLFTGTITTREPLACSPPGHLGRDKCALLPRMTVPTPAGPLDTVFLPGSTIRGRYRHACGRRVPGARAPGEPRSAICELKVGGVKGTAQERRVGLLERDAFREAQPLLSLFGAGASGIGWIHGRLDVGAALPAEPAEPVVMTGTRGDTTRDPILFEVLDEEERTPAVLGLEANRRRSQTAAELRELGKQIARADRAGEDTAELMRAREAARECGEQAARVQSGLVGSDVSLHLPLPGYEAIPPGAVLNHRMFFHHVSEIEMRFFTAGLVAIRRRPPVRRPPCPRLRSRRVSSTQVKRLDGVHARNAGEVSIDPDRWGRDESSLVLTGAPARWLDAWHDAARSP